MIKKTANLRSLVRRKKKRAFQRQKIVKKKKDGLGMRPLIKNELMITRQQISLLGLQHLFRSSQRSKKKRMNQVRKRIIGHGEIKSKVLQMTIMSTKTKKTILKIS